MCPLSRREIDLDTMVSRVKLAEITADETSLGSGVP